MLGYSGAAGGEVGRSTWRISEGEMIGGKKYLEDK